MIATICFIMLTGSNMDKTYSKMLVPTNRIVSVVSTKKDSMIKLLNTQYDGSYDIKETPEQVADIIKKECK